MIRFAPALTLALLAGPVLAGLAGVMAPAFGYLPALGGTSLSLDPWRALMGWPGLGASLRLSLVTGVAATALSLAITLAIVAAWQGTAAFSWITRLLAPLLSLPHAATAFGLAFLIAPSGWIARALSPGLTGWERPPDLLVVNDPAGFALIAGLVAKEVPFLLLMTLAALGQADAARRMLVAQSLGYGRVTGWVKAVLPHVYAQIRLPVYAVLAYSLSVVDVALILGPTRPPTLAVQVLEWMNAPDLGLRFQASAGAAALLGLVLGVLASWRLAELGLARLGRDWAANGARGSGLPDLVVRPLSLGLAGLVGLSVLAGLAGLAVWSFAGLWRFPDLLPQSYTFSVWSGQMRGLVGATRTTLAIGASATLLALVLVLACLEADYRRAAQAPRAIMAVIYVPLIIPQMGFLPGLTTLALVTGVDGTLWAVVAVHLVFVLPYVALSLADPWRAWEPRAGLVARALGASDARVFWAVRLPMLTRAILIATAIGFATSVAQYLPTLLIGAGRISTLTTEAVALSAGNNRRLIGVWAALQMALPFLVFALALLVPALLFIKRKGMAIE